MKSVSEKLQSAAEVDVSGLCKDAAVQNQLNQMHRLSLRVCPDCLVEQRRDKALIYVPRERSHLPKGAPDKNLLTVWPRRTPLGVRVMFPKQPTPGEEAFSESLVNLYESRMRDLYREVLSVPLKGDANG